MNIDRLVLTLNEIIKECDVDKKIFVEEIISKIADSNLKNERYFDKKFFERVCIEGAENVFKFNNNELVIV